MSQSTKHDQLNRETKLSNLKNTPFFGYTISDEKKIQFKSNQNVKKNTVSFKSIILCCVFCVMF